MTVNGLVLLLNSVSAAAAFGAATFWFLSVSGSLTPMRTYWDGAPPDDPFYRAFVRSIKLSRIAAILAGVSAVALAVSLAFQVGASAANPLVNLNVDWTAIATVALALVALFALNTATEEVKTMRQLSKLERTDDRLREAFNDFQPLVDLFDYDADVRNSREAVKGIFGGCGGRFNLRGNAAA